AFNRARTSAGYKWRRNGRGFYAISPVGFSRAGARRHGQQRRSGRRSAAPHRLVVAPLCRQLTSNAERLGRR
ncbi:MAG: hypothetical protein WBD33_17210, partial [Xanthobacteraceae bacterium]